MIIYGGKRGQGKTIFLRTKMLNEIRDQKASGTLYSVTRHRCEPEKDRYYAQIFENGEPISKMYRISAYDPNIPCALWGNVVALYFVPSKKEV